MINIAIAPDHNYIEPAAVAITSLLENRNDEVSIYLTYLEGELSDDSLNLLNDIAYKYQSQIQFVCIKKEFLQNFPIARCGFSTYLRLFLPWALPNVEIIIYLDCDVIVEKPLDELFHTDLGDNCMAAVADYYSKNFFHQQSIGYNHHRPYVNAGVLLMNLRRLRNLDMQKNIERYLKQHRHDLLHADQDIINVLVPGIRILHLRYNVNMYIWVVPAIFPTPWKRKERKEAINSPVIIHFLGDEKPWQGIRLKFADRWWHYAELTLPAIRDSFMAVREQGMQPSRKKRFRFYKDGIRNSMPHWLLRLYYKIRLQL
jgi:lipopolysaccharide biosynthesis glycosyltransferase